MAKTNGFTLDLTDTAASEGVGAAEFFTTNFQKQEVLAFTLTTESLMQVTGDQGVNSNPGLSGILYDSDGNVLLAIPNTEFSFDDSLTLEPGT